MNILENINSPKDVKNLSENEMKVLADEIRQGVLTRVNTIGGHLGPDLGIVEATIALHYVFNSPVDKFVFDVSHQCYPHKMLTGRKLGFTNPAEHQEISGYFNPDESEHDTFVIGHTSTSVSLATGLAKARDLKGEKYNVVALIGDGSLSGGEAFEGLDNAAVLNSNIIVIVNDNEMSIAENQGGLYKNLELLRKTNGSAELNYFKALGFEYLYVENGNDTKCLIEAFEKVKDTEKPTVVHIHTLKGKGYKPAEENKEWGHWAIPGFMDEKQENTAEPEETYASITTDYILKKQKEDNTVIAISPATPGATGFGQDFRNALGNNYTDVGIAEEHAVAYSSALAKNGAKPILGILSSFVQRTYDQLSQDLALNNSPATILVYWGALSPMDATHLGCFDIPLISNIPNIVYLSPTCKEEYLKMLDFAVEQTSYPVVIRVPFGEVVSSGKEDNTDYSILNKFETVESGQDVAIIGVGNFYHLGEKVKSELSKKLGIKATLINPKFLTGLDEELLNNLKQNHKLVITLEDGCLEGGFGEKVSRFYGNSEVKVLNFGGKKEFTDRMPLEEIYERYHLTPELIVQDVQNCLKG